MDYAVYKEQELENSILFQMPVEILLMIEINTKNAKDQERRCKTKMLPR
jgi:hypothetical protein